MKEADTGQRQESTGQEKLTAETINKQPTLENTGCPGTCTYNPQEHPAIPHEMPPRAKRPAKSVKKEPTLPTARGKRKAPKVPELQTTAHIPLGSLHAEAVTRLPRGPEDKDALGKNAEFGAGSVGIWGNDHDDENIGDHDVLKGLQVVIQAATDEVFDTLIHDKTGLRIRRFLADLKMVGALDVATGDQRARPWRTMESRVTRGRERKSRAGPRT